MKPGVTKARRAHRPALAAAKTPPEPGDEEEPLQNPYSTQRLRTILYVVVGWTTTYEMARYKTPYFARGSINC